MKKIFSVLCFIIALVSVQAATGDTTIITSHTNTNLNSPPSDDDIWAVFPNNGTTYQKIIMKFTLGCGTPNCSGWDYTVNALLGKKDGGIDTTIVSIDTLTHDTVWNYADHVNFIEVGRLITPYGTYMAGNSNGFNNSWTQPYYYDVTDYAQLLKDSVSVRVHYDGWTDAFSAKVEFIMVEGPPTRTVESVREIYHAYIGYPNSAGFESVATPQTFFIDPSVTSAKVLVNMTGHGSQGEFDPHYFHIIVNNQYIYDRILWKDDCGRNAVAPQGGTWIFNRANWCPGEKVPLYEIDITPYITPGQNVTVDLDMDDFTIQSGESAGYGLSAHLITYTNQKNNDVMMEEIISPNADKPYLRFNPISTNPKVKIKNMGKLPLTYAQINYGVENGVTWYYEWTGNLPPFESEIVTLPSFDWFGVDTITRGFYAEAKWPNNVPDEYEYNNKLQSTFDMTPQLDSVFVIYFKTNNHPEENWYVVKNAAGDTVDFKDTFNATTQYRDTLRLPAGSYSFDFYDYDANWEGGDGISWWLNTQQGLETSGLLRLYRMNNTVLKNFNGDFGNNIHYEFTVGYPLGYNGYIQAPTEPQHPTGIETIANLKANMNVYPNPANDLLNIQLNLSSATGGTITLTDIAGRSIQQVSINDNETNQNILLQTAQLSRGLYFVTLNTDKLNVTKKVILQ